MQGTGEAKDTSLGERLDSQVEILNPFRKITPGSKDVTPELDALGSVLGDGVEIRSGETLPPGTLLPEPSA